MEFWVPPLKAAQFQEYPMGLELLEIGPWSWNFTGGEFPNQQRQREGGSGIAEIPTNIWQLPWKGRFPWDLRDASTVGILGASSKGRSQSWIIPRSCWKSLQLEFHRGRIPKAANTGKRGIWELEGTEGDLSLFPPKKKIPVGARTTSLEKNNKKGGHLRKI